VSSCTISILMKNCIEMALMLEIYVPLQRVPSKGHPLVSICSSNSKKCMRKKNSGIRLGR
jgi:hypothetical protein